MSEGILAYRLLKSANLLEQHEELAKATTRAALQTVMDTGRLCFTKVSCKPYIGCCCVIIKYGGWSCSRWLVILDESLIM